MEYSDSDISSGVPGCFVSSSTAGSISLSSLSDFFDET